MKYKQIFLVISLLTALFAINACEEPLKQSDLDLKEEPTLDGVMSSLTNGSSESVVDRSTSLETMLSSDLEVSSSRVIDTSKSSEVIGSSTALSSGVALSHSSLLSSSAAIVLETVKAVKMSPTGGTFTSNTKVILSSTTVGSQIRYTLDGKTPIESSPLYEDSILVNSSLTLKASAFKSGMTTSPFTEGVFDITGTVASPIFSIDPNTYTTTQTVSLNTTTSGATIYFTTDESTPSASSNQYTSAISVNATTTIKAIAIKSTWGNSSVLSGLFTITGKVANPTFGLAAGTYSKAQSVTLSTSTSGATIFYTTDGSTPSISSLKYTGAISVSGDQTIKAMATKSDWDNSDAVSSAYVITGTVASPSFSISPKTYTTTQSVTLSTATSGASIYYTTDGSMPSASSVKYNSPISVSTTTTLKAIAIKSTWSNSEVTSGVFTITGKVANPDFGVTAGTYATSQSVTITTTTPGSAIYYTVDGSNPSSSSLVYGSAISVVGTQTIKAIAVKGDWVNSDMVSSSYVITGKMSAPTISPATEVYQTSQTITMTAAVGSIIHYTLDGSNPTTSSTVYVGSFNLNSTATVKAIAVKPKWIDSDVTSNLITITGKVSRPTMTPNGGAHGDSVIISFSSSTPGVTFYFTTDGTDPTSSSFSLPSFTLRNTKTVKVIAVKDGWANSDVFSNDFEIQTYCEANPSRCIKDDRDNKVYKTTTIGTQVWMAENLNFGTYVEEVASDSHYQKGAQKFCYSNQPSNCISDGGLYQWHTAMNLPPECGDGSKTCSDQISIGGHQGICPTGWHIPQKAEWDQLTAQLGGSNVTGKKIKSSEMGGTDDFGFTAIAAGYRYYNGGFTWRGSHSYFWEADEDDKYDGFYRKLNKGNNSFDSFPYYKKTGASIRCIKD